MTGLGNNYSGGAKVVSVLEPSNTMAFIQPNNTVEQKLGAQGGAFMVQQRVDELEPDNSHDKGIRYNTNFADGSVRLLHQTLVEKSLYRDPSEY